MCPSSTVTSSGDNERKLYAKCDLNFIPRLFAFYGLRLHGPSSPAVKSPQVVVALASLLLMFVYEVYETVTRLVADRQSGRLTKIEICQCIQLLSLQVAIAVQYVYVVCSSTDVRHRLRTLCDIVYKEILAQTDGRSLRRINSGLNLAAYVSIILLTIALLTVHCYNVLFKLQSASWPIFYCLKAVVCVYYIVFVVGLCMFYNMLVILLNVHLARLVDCHVLRANLNDVGLHQRRHRTMNQLLRIGDQLFSTFLLCSLAFELILIVTYAKASFESIYSLNGLLNLLQVIFFVCKNLCCSTFNEKVQSSLSSYHGNGYSPCTSNELNYIFYLDQVANDKQEITYGGIFPVSKAFIFTVAGTALSYAMIINEL